MKWVKLLGVAALAANALSAQTLQDAEALHQARRYWDSNELYKKLEATHANDPEFKVKWGRLFLDSGRADLASSCFDEALAVKKDEADAILGLAIVASEAYEARAADLAHKALEIDPKLTEAQELLAYLALEDNDNQKATEEAHKALAMDKDSVGGKAILAIMDWLADKKETQWDPHTAKGYEIAGHFFVINRRYEEGIQYFRKAIEMDPKLFSAHSQLGVNLMRLGRDKEAYAELELAYKGYFQDAATVNSLKLMDTYSKYETFTTPRTILKVHTKEAALLKPYFESEMLRAIDTYEKKYRMKLQHPVQVEVYPNHEDFAVRTMGLPGLGALGVTFGYSIAMDSPSGRPPGQFHWASTLWHEMSHVFTLTATNHRVPRWFTEGMAVHEETAISPDWGDRLSPDVIAAIKNKKLLPVTQLDRGFVHPTTPGQIIISYFQGGQICDYINDKWGWDTLLAMLHDFADGAETSAVIRKELKIEPEEFDKRFFAFVEDEFKVQVAGFDDWRKGLKAVAEATANKDWGEVIKLGTPLRDKYPDYVEEHSIYEMLAKAYAEKGDKAKEIEELQRYEKIGGRSPETLKLLSKELEAAGRNKEAADALNRLNFIYPMDEAAHRSLGSLWLGQNNPKGAIREFQAVLAKKPMDQAQAHYDLARAFHANHQNQDATDECLASLEAAPGFRPAQKLLVELSNSQEPAAQPAKK